MIWLWRDTGDTARVAHMALSSSLYVLASLPALLLLARLAPWGEAEARGAFDPERDPT